MFWTWRTTVNSCLSAGNRVRSDNRWTKISNVLLSFPLPASPPFFSTTFSPRPSHIASSYPPPLPSSSPSSPPPVFALTGWIVIELNVIITHSANKFLIFKAVSIQEQPKSVLGPILKQFSTIRKLRTCSFRYYMDWTIGWTTAVSGVLFPRTDRRFNFPSHPDWLLDSPSFLSKILTSVSSGQNSHAVTLTTHHTVVLRLRMHGAVTLLPLTFFVCF